MSPSRKKLIYIDHSFHKKTKSNLFLVDILSKEYDVNYIFYDPDIGMYDMNGSEISDNYDILLLFQVIVNIDDLKNRFKAKKYVYVPMYDGTGEMPDSFWIEYKDFNIINFSRTLHKRLKKKGFSTHYIQFFPKPYGFELGEPGTLYYWQRKEELEWNIVKEVISGVSLSKVIFHDAPDPEQKVGRPSKEDEITYNIEYSGWYQNKSVMLDEIKKCQMYFSPRLYEGIGMSFLEAMAMGKVVIAADNPTMNEYIISGKTGLLFRIKKPIKAISEKKILRMQNKTYKYMCDGYKKWVSTQDIISEWVAEEIKTNSNKLERTEKLAGMDYVKYSKSGNVILTINNGVYRLFDIIPCDRRLITIMTKIIKKIRRLI